MRIKYLCETFCLSSVVYLTKLDQEISAEFYIYSVYSVARP